MSAKSQKEAGLKFNAPSKCELLIEDRCVESGIFVMKSLAENERVSPHCHHQRYLSFTCNHFWGSFHFIIINALTMQVWFHALGRSP